MNLTDPNMELYLLELGPLRDELVNEVDNVLGEYLLGNALLDNANDLALVCGVRSGLPTELNGRNGCNGVLIKSHSSCGIPRSRIR